MASNLTPTDPTSETQKAPPVRKQRAPRKRVAAAQANESASSPDETVTLTRAQLEELVARLTASKTPVSTSAPVTGTDFLSAVKEIIAETRPVEKITVANRVAHNPMNPNNEPRAWASGKQFYQNYEKVDVEDVTPEEYALIPQLKSGLFVKSRKGVPLLEVIVVKRGASRGIHLRYDNSRADKNMELMTYAPTLEIMLQKCIKEHAAQQDVKAKRIAAGLPPEEDE